MRFLAITAVALIAAGGAAGSTAPRVALADRDPVRVVGVGFAAYDRVTVRVREPAGSSFGRLVTAGKGGGFVVRFPTRSIDPCSGYVVTATGTSGRRATGRELPPPCGIDPGQ